MASEFWEKIKRVDAVSNEGRVIALVFIMAGATLLNGVLSLVMLSWIPLAATLFGWAFVAVYALFQGTALDSAGQNIGRILVPTGNSTPSVAQHSNIEAMEVRGEYAKAADAYQAAIEANPEDTVACEKLGQLALRQLKDYDRAIWAYRQAEQRHPEPRRRLGYAILVAGIYRDNLEDNGKAIVELRRILARYPDAPNTDRLRAELDELKARHFEGT